MPAPSYALPELPPIGITETPATLRMAAKAHRHLAELKGSAGIIPNQNILIDTLSLQEAKSSSEIENIVTTQDELFQASLFPAGMDRGPAKEVARYREALKLGFDAMKKSEGLLTNNMLIAIFRLLKRTDGTFRATPGTALKNESTGEFVYVPPQDANNIVVEMTRLERFINDNKASALDPLVKMAIIHHQFESIHPFPDGNGRIGRIINVLYLVQQELLDTPILYMSRYINSNKSTYYALLQSVREDSDWEPWLLFILAAVAETAADSVVLVRAIRDLMAGYKNALRDNFPKIYSQDLLNNLFRHPYTRVEFLQNELQVSRPTATKYLDALTQGGLLKKFTSGRNNYYVNVPLIALLARNSD